jgi:hypothetical protein
VLPEMLDDGRAGLLFPVGDATLLAARVERIFRDARAAGAHIHFSTDMQMSQWGLVAAGGEERGPAVRGAECRAQ